MLLQMQLSFVHACVATIFGIIYLPPLADATPEVAYNCSEAWAFRPVATMCTIFVVYLLIDLALGVVKRTLKSDWVIHHLLFIIMSMLQLWYSRSCLPFCWLIIGEFSTIFLDIRWYLIGTEQTESRSGAFMAVQVLFLISFVATRIILYGWGLWRFFFENENVFADLSPWQLTPVALFAGYGLNWFWLFGILGSISRKKPKGKRHTA